MKYRRQSGYIQFEEDTFAKIAQGIGKIFLEEIGFSSFLQTKPQVRSVNKKYYDLCIWLLNKIGRSMRYQKKYFKLSIPYK